MCIVSMNSHKRTIDCKALSGCGWGLVPGMWCVAEGWMWAGVVAVGTVVAWVMAWVMVGVYRCPGQRVLYCDGGYEMIDRYQLGT